MLENAIYHGVELLPNGGEIVVSGRQEDGQLEIELTNPVADGRARESDGNRMALANIKERFELAFAGKGTVDLVERDGLFTATLRFPEKADVE